MKPITNVEVERNSRYSQYSLSCEFDGARYHVWLDNETREVQPVLYKNSLAGHGEPGHYDTRRLRINSESAQRLITQMMNTAVSEQLFTKADERLAEQERQAAAEQAEQGRRHLIREAAPKMYTAIRQVAFNLALEGSDYSLTEDTRNFLFANADMLNAAIEGIPEEKIVLDKERSVA